MNSLPTEKDLRTRLDAGLAALNLALTEEQRIRLLDYIKLLRQWNQAYNLTAVRDPLQMISRHLLDSLALAPYLSGSPMLDLGTGPGLPGIPLAILAPEKRVSLLDSNGKKIRFVRQALLALGLSNITVVQARMESFRPEEKFATITSRAVAPLAILQKVAAPLLTHPGRLLVMKGRCPEDEQAALETLGATRLAVHRLTIPYLDAERHLIEICQD